MLKGYLLANPGQITPIHFHNSIEFLPAIYDNIFKIKQLEAKVVRLVNMIYHHPHVSRIQGHSICICIGIVKVKNQVSPLDLSHEEKTKFKWGGKHDE